MKCEEKRAYLSEMLADNAAILHGWGFPTCAGVTVYRCGDHWHYGHATPAASAACRASATVRHRSWALVRQARRDRGRRKARHG